MKAGTTKSTFKVQSMDLKLAANGSKQGETPGIIQTVNKIQKLVRKEFTFCASGSVKYTTLHFYYSCFTLIWQNGKKNLSVRIVKSAIVIVRDPT